MNKLISQLQRLYFLPDQSWHSSEAGGSSGLAEEGNIALRLVSADGTARAMLIGFERAGDWAQVSKLYQALQDELDLPAPAVSVSGSDGYQLWLSLAEPVPVVQARVFLEALCRKYLADIPVVQLKLHPGNVTGDSVSLVPALHEQSGKWSAFIDPSMGAMFIEAPGLEMPPNMDRQADMLSGLASIKSADLQRATAILLDRIATGTSLPACESERGCPNLNIGEHYTDPQSFLLAVMNDPSTNVRDRIEAAKALLPYFHA